MLSSVPKRVLSALHYTRAPPAHIFVHHGREGGSLCGRQRPPLPCRTLTLLPAPPKQAPLETGKGRCLHTSAWTGVFVAAFAECQRLNIQCVQLTSCDVAGNGA